MPMNGSSGRNRSLIAVAAAALLCASTPAAQSTHDVTVVLEHVAERLTEYYKHAQNIMCVEKVTTQSVGYDMAPVGFARVIESELRVEADATQDGGTPSEVRVVRSIRKVNGRPPGPKDKESCMDPNPLSDEPLAFLLPVNRENYAFTWAGFGKGKDKRLMMLDYRALEAGKPEVRDNQRGEGCLSFSIPGAVRGRVWIDPETHDVIRVEERLGAPIDFRIPAALQRRKNFPDIVVLDRLDVYIRYKSIAFQDPAETMLLPESIDQLAVFRGAESHRIRHEFGNYKRFLTGGRIIKP